MEINYDKLKKELGSANTNMGNLILDAYYDVTNSNHQLNNTKPSSYNISLLNSYGILSNAVSNTTKNEVVDNNLNEFNHRLLSLMDAINLTPISDTTSLATIDTKKFTELYKELVSLNNKDKVATVVSKEELDKRYGNTLSTGDKASMVNAICVTLKLDPNVVIKYSDSEIQHLHSNIQHLING